MAVATKDQYWTSRINGEDPTSPDQVHHNEAWTQVGTGSAVDGDYWKVTASQFYTVTPPATSNDLTMVVGMYYSDKTDIPSDGTTLMRLDNGTHAVEVQSDGTALGLKLVGATTVSVSGILDLTQEEDSPFITIIRLSIDSSGNGKLYVHETMEDELGEDASYSVSGASGSSEIIKWGSDDGTTRWGMIYATHHGAFNPDELAISAFYQSTLNRLGIAFRDMLRNSKRLHLKSLDNSSIMYGYDLSSAMIIRVAPPTIHVVVAGVNSPEFSALSGTSTNNDYEVHVYVTTKGTDYANAYRFCLRIAGEVFDEAYTNSGLDATQDSIVSYQCALDSRLDADEQVCIHKLSFTYMRREKMLRR